MGRTPFAILFLLLLFFSPPALLAEKEPYIPKQLTPWVEWVLHGHEDKLACVNHYNNSGKLQCSWPGILRLDVREKKASFSQTWHLYKDGWITLPGSKKTWPEHVLVNNKPALIVGQANIPKIKVEKGIYTVSGSFQWQNLPEHIQISSQTGLVSLSLHGKKIEFPNLDQQGRIWLQAKSKKAKKIENRLKIQSFRLIDDKIPPRLVNHLKLDVAGYPREVVLGPVFSPASFIPVSLNSPLPTRLEADGRLRIQLRPGQWDVNLTSRHIGPLKELRYQKPEDQHWPEQEIWSFRAQNNLRVVEIRNVSAIDPKQTNMPESWRNLPAYRLLNDETLQLKEIKRGDPVPAPDQLSLERTMWLRFDGSGYTIQDIISGKKSTNWRLEIQPDIMLGKVELDGKEQFITKRKGTNDIGIELRQGIIALTADSEIKGNISQLPATGWRHDFQKVKTRLNLPPGYRLISAGGIDHISNTWINKWSLLDIFLVLIFTIAVLRLFSWQFALLALITLTLLYHEPQAPRYIWLALLIGIALLKHLPEGRFKQFVKIYQIAMALGLIALCIPFIIHHLRVGIYPQLEKPYHSMSRITQQTLTAKAPMDSGKVMRKAPAIVGGSMDMVLEESAKMSKMKNEESYRSNYYDLRRQKVAQYDPKMIKQTGPGLPNWQWNTLFLSWTGPVHQDQRITLLYLNPTANRILAFIRVGLLLILGLGIIGIRYQKGSGLELPKLKPEFRSTFLSMLLPLCFCLLLLSSPVNAQDIPSPDMFAELQKRLLQQEDCYPNCADIPSMEIDITGTDLQIHFQVNALVDAALPLPGNSKHWFPNKVQLDKNDSTILFRDHQTLWMMIPAGSHSVKLQGPLPGTDTVQLPLPVSPRHLQLQEKGWTSNGLHADGTVARQIVFKRIQKETAGSSQTFSSGVLPPFALIERSLLLGLEWKIETHVRRIGPTGSAILLDVPLLPGESVVTENMRVSNNTLTVAMNAEETYFSWESILDPVSKLQLVHPHTDKWTETWQVNPSPIYHLEYSGIPVILHQLGNRWHPTWHPWPGEEVSLIISRPTGVEGQTVTIDRSHLVVKPGQRASDHQLNISIRSSQGAQHTITLPKGGKLQEVQINKRIQPIRQKGEQVKIPLVPGKQEVTLKWRQQEGITSVYKSPAIDLGLPNVNVSIDVNLPTNRWPLLLGGPVVGPAVLFWSLIFVLILGAFALNRTGLTTLRFHHWLLLGIGMSQSSLFSLVLVIGWLIAFHYRQYASPEKNENLFNLIQVGLGLLTMMAFATLIAAISQGLLGHPDMNIVGNGSSRNLLRWYQDQSGTTLPQAWVISIPMFCYRLAMLAWSLWISFTLIRILKWCWHNFTQPALWFHAPKKEKSGLFKRRKKEKKNQEVLSQSIDYGEK